MTHAQRILAQKKAAIEDENTPEDVQERLEAEIEEDEDDE